MQLELILLFTSIGICVGNVQSGQRSVRAIGDTSCMGVTRAGVRCISRTEFVMAFQDPKDDPPIKCPSGMVCADVQNICSNSHQPICNNEVPGAEGVCNMCPPNRLYNPVCVSDKEYAFCVKGKIQTSLIYKCKPPNMYCKASFDGSKPPRLNSICTSNAVILDCPSGYVQNRNGTAENAVAEVDSGKPKGLIAGLVDSLIKASEIAKANVDKTTAN